MSRADYSDDIDNWALIRWRGAVNAALKGRRGQRFLRDLAAALDAMPTKELIADEVITDAGGVCAVGAVLQARGLSAAVAQYDPEDVETLARLAGIAPALYREIAFLNDDNVYGLLDETPQRQNAARWRRMRAWVTKHLIPERSAP